MTTSISHKSKHFRFMEALAKGEVIGTDNRTCSRFGTNQIPDLARKAKLAGMPVQAELVYCEQHRTNVARYRLPKTYQRKWLDELSKTKLQETG